ncbi:Cd2+/Zn2+-exporting ATPase [Marininema mesophilum]|uniref:Cd(2+)-exporting ATPase n=1 Tax=Marininema mesophilum TaxID=1048340 RepID=A0A1H2ZNV4_9BACL|nr:heavy metal translocating P-type ATPase [Marininema mesophilum]SDX19077.1 Cd2+/Zn2+-exporting ATPase [Marininema mesophilum]
MTEQQRPEKKETSCCSGSPSIPDKPSSCCYTSTQPNPKPEGIPSCCEGSSSICEHHEITQQTIEIRVQGMDCPSCAKTIEKSIVQLPGVAEVQVHYSAGKMRIKGDAPNQDVILRQLKRLGFTGIWPEAEQPNTQTFYVEGMDCGSCAQSIEKHLRVLPWVDTVNVHFSTGKMHLVHSGTTAAIQQEVAKVGYRATPRHTSVSKSPKISSHLLWVGGAGLLMLLGFISDLAGLLPLAGPVFFSLAILVGGYKPAKSAFFAVKNRSLDMNVLMVGAAIGAAFIGEWSEGALVVWLFAVGNWLQTQSIERTRTSIRELMELAPAEAWVSSSSGWIRQNVESIAIGQRIMVKPGEKIPLDGIVLEGTTSVNQAPITGESIPVDKMPGNEVYAGTVNESGAVEIEVTRLEADTTLAKIIRLVEEAQEKQAPTQDLVDRFARVYTPIVFILALLTMVLPPLFGGDWRDWLYRGVELLVIACPCALVISTPVAIVSAIGNAAKNGVLIKGGAFLEITGKLTAIAFDKTGTLTEGKPQVTRILTAEGVDEADLLSVASGIEEGSRHPIAQAITHEVDQRNIGPKQGTSHRAWVGKGAQATINEEVYYVGNEKMFEGLRVALNDWQTPLKEWQEIGYTPVLVGTDQQILGLIAISDSVRTTSRQTVQQLKAVGIQKVVMLTGDQPGTAHHIGSEADVDEVFAGLLPEEKMEKVQEIQRQGHKLGMVGDGMNDAPALAQADLGIAMGGAGTDTAMETADIVLMADNLEKLPSMIRLSRKALLIIKQNIAFSIAVKLLALLLIVPNWLTLWMAVLSDTGAALLVILNSMRLLRDRK